MSNKHLGTKINNTIPFIITRKWNRYKANKYMQIFRGKRKDYYTTVVAKVNFVGLYDNDYDGRYHEPKLGFIINI